MSLAAAQQKLSMRSMHRCANGKIGSLTYAFSRVERAQFAFPSLGEPPWSEQKFSRANDCNLSPYIRVHTCYSHPHARARYVFIKSGSLPHILIMFMLCVSAAISTRLYCAISPRRLPQSGIFGQRAMVCTSCNRCNMPSVDSRGIESIKLNA